MFSTKFYVIVSLLMLVMLMIYFIYNSKKKKKNKITKKDLLTQNEKVKTDLKSLREKLSKTNDPITKNEILNKINLIIGNFKK